MTELETTQFELLLSHLSSSNNGLLSSVLCFFMCDPISQLLVYVNEWYLCDARHTTQC